MISMICVLHTHHKYYFPTWNSIIIFQTQTQYNTIATVYYLEAKICHEVQDLSFQKVGEIHKFLFILISAFFSARVT
jgi:hypothetical protein